MNTKKKKQFSIGKLLLGDEMEFPAKQLIKQVMTNAKCKVLSNCHLSLEFRAELEENL
jgi:hypothetical protein